MSRQRRHAAVCLLAIGAVVANGGAAAPTAGIVPTSISPALRRLHVKGIEYHTSSSDEPAQAEPLPIAAVVHHREQVMGCHSFERFLSPRWETVFVVEDVIADIWQLSNVIRATPSRGAHLLTLGVSTGEWLARAIALRHLDELKRRPPLLLSSQCDMQPLPPWHALHIPYAAFVERFTAAFLAESHARARGTTITTIAMQPPVSTKVHVPLHATAAGVSSTGANCAAVFKAAGRPLFVMNTPIFETLPHAASLEDAKFQLHRCRTLASVVTRRDGAARSPDGHNCRTMAL